MNGTTLWWNHCSLVGTRALTSEEVALLKREFKSFRVLARLRWLPIPLSLVLMMSVASALDSAKYIDASTLLATVAFVGSVVVYMIGRDKKKCVQKLRLDLENPFVNQYRTPNETLIEVLPCSNRIWTEDGSWRRKYDDPFEQMSVANLPEIAGIAADFAVPVFEDLEHQLSMNRRELSDGELQELRLHRRKLLRIAVIGFGCAVYSGAGAISPFFDSSLNVGTYFIARALLLGGIALAGVYACVHLLTHGARIQRDIAAGDAVIIKVESEEENPVREVLPFSWLLWTDDSKPATWRTNRFVPPINPPPRRWPFNDE